MEREHYKPEDLTEENNLTNKIIYSKREKYEGCVEGRNVMKNLRDACENREEIEILKRQIKRREDFIEKMELNE